MHLIDSHCHLDFPSFSDDLDGVLTRAVDAGIHTVLAVGIGDGPSTMHRALDLARQAPNGTATPKIYASAGIHPQEADHATPEALAKLRALSADPLVIAIGEIGLDFYHLDNPSIDMQKSAFLAQMEIAVEVRKPILIHCRTSDLATPEARSRFSRNGQPADAQADLLRLIAEHFAPHGIGGIMHCFSGTAAEAQAAHDLGFYISFAGNLTYNRFANIREAAAIVPLDRILVETDAPFLAPQPHRGERNEPARTRVTAQFLADLRGLPLTAIADATTANFHRLFRIH